MKRVFVVISILTIFGVARPSYAQTARQEVFTKLSSLKPRSTVRYRYAVKVPATPRAIPHDIRIDLVYKIGHYDFEYVAVRYEKRANDPDVDVTYYSYGSALAFMQEIRKSKETFTAKHGKVPVADFDRLATLAFLYFDSDITERYVPQRVFRNGRWIIEGEGGGSGSWSSGDGSILIGASTGPGFLETLIRDSGSLMGGELRERMDRRYETVRPHLFWQVFYDHVRKATFLRDLPRAEVEDKVLERVLEPHLSNDYKDYYRQGLFVELLGEFGCHTSIQALSKLRAHSGLEPDWHKHLQQDADKAMIKIASRR